MSLSPRRVIRTLIVDDDPHYAELLAALLGADPRVALVGRAADGAEGVELAVRLRPDVVVMDVEMPVLDGIAAARRIRMRLRGTRVVLVSGAGDAHAGGRARAVGAHAFLRKSGDGRELLDAVTGCSRGTPAASPCWRLTAA